MRQQKILNLRGSGGYVVVLLLQSGKSIPSPKAQGRAQSARARWQTTTKIHRVPIETTERIIATHGRYSSTPLKGLENLLDECLTPFDFLTQDHVVD